MQTLAGVEPQPQADEAADGEPAVVEGLDAQPVDDVRDVGAEPLERVVLVGSVAVAVASEIDRDDSPRPSELPELVVPHVVGAAQRVHEHDRRCVRVPEEVECDLRAVADRHRLRHVTTSSDDSELPTASIAAPAVMNTRGSANHSACHEPWRSASSCGLPVSRIVATPAHASAAAIARIASIGSCFPAAALEPPPRVFTSSKALRTAMSPATFSAHWASRSAFVTMSRTGVRSLCQARG